MIRNYEEQDCRQADATGHLSSAEAISATMINTYAPDSETGEAWPELKPGEFRSITRSNGALLQYYEFRPDVSKSVDMSRASSEVTGVNSLVTRNKWTSYVGKRLVCAKINGLVRYGRAIENHFAVLKDLYYLRELPERNGVVVRVAVSVMIGDELRTRSS